MHIYVDESGIFANPANNDMAVSCMAAVVIPEPFQKYIFKRFKYLKSSWGMGDVEPKGSRLDEKQVSQVVSVLSRYDVIIKALVIDMGLHTDAHILVHKQGQADGMTKNLTPKHHPNLVRQLKELAARVEHLPNQLYVQSCVLSSLVDSVIRVSTLYYCQRVPLTLSSFKWVIDAKGEKVSDYEDLWSTIVMPMLQSSSLNNPMISLQEGDYSSFNRKFDMTMPAPPEYLMPHIRCEIPAEPFHCCDVKKIMTESLAFESSENNLGLQLADIVTNAIRRALHGNLQVDGWGDLGKLMVKNEKGKNSLEMIVLHNEVVQKRLPYGAIFRHFDKQSKPMLSPKFM
jgi:hypothetical protein